MTVMHVFYFLSNPPSHPLSPCPLLSPTISHDILHSHAHTHTQRFSYNRAYDITMQCLCRFRAHFMIRVGETDGDLICVPVCLPVYPKTRDEDRERERERDEAVSFCQSFQLTFSIFPDLLSFVSFHLQLSTCAHPRATRMDDMMHE